MSGPSAKQVLEALLFAAAEPLDEAALQLQLGEAHLAELLAELQQDYAERGVRLERQGRAWAFRTAPEVAPLLQRTRVQARKLSRAALETLAVIAYQQPVTRAEIEAARGRGAGAGHPRPPGRGGLGGPQGAPRGARAAGHLGHHPGVSRPFRAGGSLDDLPRLDELEGASFSIRRATARSSDPLLPWDAHEPLARTAAAPARSGLEVRELSHRFGRSAGRRPRRRSRSRRARSIAWSAHRAAARPPRCG